MVESMFKAAKGDIERFNRKFMILSKVGAGHSDTIPATLSASLSAQAKDKGYVQKNLGYCTVCKVMVGVEENSGW